MSPIIIVQPLGFKAIVTSQANFAEDRERADKARSASFADALDGISAALFLVEADGRIVHANAAGNVMLDTADVLRARAGRIVANDPQADLTLAEIFAAASKGDAATGGPVALSLQLANFFIGINDPLGNNPHGTLFNPATTSDTRSPAP
jgi:PAS domain-containing protein